jgi:poly-gamma-glutamate synthesis protein (capsule biosynthesis protein)
MRIKFVGDIMPGELVDHYRRGVSSQIAAGKDPFRFCRSELLDADLSVANLECVLSHASSLSRPWSELLRGQPSFAGLLRSVGISVVNTANNHALDHGKHALAESIQHLREAGVQTFGYDEVSLFQETPLVVSRSGLRIGFLGYNIANYSRDDATRSIARIEQITSEAARIVDFLIVSMHWGREYTAFPDSTAICVAQRFFERGCNILYGHHSHRLQGIVKMGNNLFVPSLGNFIFDDHGKADRITAILSVTLEDKRIRHHSIFAHRICAKLCPTPEEGLRSYISNLNSKLSQATRGTEAQRKLDDLRARLSSGWGHTKNRVRIRVRMILYFWNYTQHWPEFLRYFLFGHYSSCANRGRSDIVARDRLPVKVDARRPCVVNSDPRIR